MSTKVLITGGAGYLGSVLTHRLLLKGYKVTVLDNFMHRQTSLSHLCIFPELDVIRGDSREISRRWKRLLDEHDVFVPLAALVGAPACDLDISGAWDTNCRAVVALCHNVASPDKLIIYPNTNSGYGVGGESECTEESPLLPVSEYGRSKVQAEKAVLSFGGISLRFATLFGASPRMRLDLLVNDFVLRAVRDGFLGLYENNFRRNFLHVRDAAEAIIFIIEKAAGMRGHAFNAGDSRANVTKLGLCQRIQAVVPQFSWGHAEGQDPDKRDYIVSNAKLESLGWRPAYSLEDGIAELARCFAQPFSSEHRNI